MNKKLKTGILSLLLVVPVFFIILVFFGQNYYKLPRFNPVKIKKDVSGEEDTIFHKITPFLSGKYFKHDLKTNEINVFFICDRPFSNEFEIVSSNISSVEEAYKNENRVSIFTFIDIAKDSISLKQLEDKFVSYPKRQEYINVERNIDSLIKKGFKIDSNSCSKLVLSDKRGIIRGYYNGKKQKEIDRLITEINVLIHEYEHQIPER